MSKTQTFMTVTIDITHKQALFAAQCIADEWFEDYGKDVFALLGMTEEDLEIELMELPAFTKMIRQAVIDRGEACLYDVYDYMNFDIVEESKEMNGLRDTLVFLQEILNDVYSKNNDDCAEAIATLKRAGYKIVRA
jgi:hypothetical protein